MFKNIIAPVQAWLLSQGRCVGCGRDLVKKEGEGLVRVDCECGRIYMYDAASAKYRRATVGEIK
jgi:hypothetical protein